MLNLYWEKEGLGQKEEWENEKAESITVPSTAVRVMGRKCESRVPQP